MPSKKGRWVLEITFKDGRSLTLEPIPGGGDEAIKDFEERKKMIAIELVYPGKAVIPASEIRAMIPRWISEDGPNSS